MNLGLKKMNWLWCELKGYCGKVRINFNNRIAWQKLWSGICLWKFCQYLANSVDFSIAEQLIKCSVHFFPLWIKLNPTNTKAKNFLSCAFSRSTRHHSPPHMHVCRGGVMIQGLEMIKEGGIWADLVGQKKSVAESTLDK